MAMDSTRTQTAAPTPAAVLPQEAGLRRTEPSSLGEAEEGLRKAAGYGLPCAKCRLYYPADLDSCPTCHHKERVSAMAPMAQAKVAKAGTEAAAPDGKVLEQEREEFLRQFKSQLMQAHIGVANSPASVCMLSENHKDETANAEICRHCYDLMQERLDVCEAALHLDLKEAAQIIYDAVWADPSDPSKTYQNAANALLVELRKRAGMATLRGPFHPLSH